MSVVHGTHVEKRCPWSTFWISYRLPRGNFVHIEQEEANYGSRAKSGPLIVFINKVLLE